MNLSASTCHPYCTGTCTVSLLCNLHERVHRVSLLQKTHDRVMLLGQIHLHSQVLAHCLCCMICSTVM